MSESEPRASRLLFLPGPAERRLVGRLWGWVRPYRRLFLTAGVCTAVSIPASVAVPLLMREIFDRALAAGDIALVRRLALAIVALTLVHQALTFVADYLLARFHHRFDFDLRLRLYRHLQRLSLRYFDDRPAGYLMSRQTDDVDQLRGVLADTFISALLDAVKAIALVGLLFYVEPFMALTGLAVVAALFGSSAAFSSRLRRGSRRAQESGSVVSAALHETIAGVRLMQASAAERREARRFGARLADHVRAAWRRDLLGIFHSRVASLLSGFGLIAIVFVGVYRILYGDFSVGGLVAFFMYLTSLFGAAAGLVRLNPVLQRAIASAERILEVVDEVPEITSPPGALAPPTVRGHVRFEAVTFGYDPDQPVLHDVDLDVRPGEGVAIVGPSGAGKSTLVSLVPRFYDATHGAVRVDGVDVRELRVDTLRSAIGIVPQDIFLFNRTVRENLLYGRPDATEAEMIEAARAAHAHEFVRELPDGYDALIGERGVKLSGGQRQRLAIAREMLREPAIIVLDEATSSLDSTSERLIQDALARLLRGRTSFVIAHRLSTVLHADRILVLDGGRIVESGPHAELVQRDGLYALLYRTQLSRTPPGEPDRASTPPTH